MLSYRKLAMRVLGRPLHTGGGIDSPRPASQRAAAFILTAAMLTTLTAPAFAKTWDIEKGDITVKAGEAEGPNKVKQGDSDFVKDEGDTIITGTSDKNTVTIETEKKGDKVEVTLKDVNIEATGGKAAVSVTGKGDTNIELDGDNKLSGSGAHAALEHNQTVDSEKNVTSGKLTIQDDNDKAGSLTATGGIQNGAGIGAGGYRVSSGKIEITGGDITAVGGKSAAGIGGSGYRGNADITISGGTIRATGGDQAAGIGGGGLYGSGNITITGDAVIEESIGGSSGAGAGNATGGAGIGGGAGGYGTIVISGNAQVKNAVGKDGGAGIGGGVYGLGRVTIEGGTTVNATGGLSAAGIGGGYGAENDEDDGIGNKIIIRNTKDGIPDITATGGDSKLNYAGIYIPGGAGIGSGAGDGSTEGVSLADADITIEGTINIVAKGGKDNSAIGANGIEQEFNGLAEGSSITRCDSEGNDISLPGDKVPVTETSSGGGSATPSADGGSATLSAPASPLPGLTVTDKDGQRISYTSTQSGNTLTVCVGRFTASFHISLSALRQLRAEGIETITFQTILCSTSLSVDELLAMGGEDAEAVLTHRFTVSSLTVG